MKKILMVTMSDHTSFQDGVFSMYENLKDRYKVTTLTMKNSDYPAPRNRDNLFIDAPKRPGITKDTFNVARIHHMMKMIRNTDFDVVYFESFHVWNYPIMLYCKNKHIPVAHAINDVIPHACKRAKPLFEGHNQPRIPLNKNYYDLSQKENIRWQMKLAKEYGIDGFAIYQYYSCGNKLLEIPLELIRDDSTLDLPFYLYWANESWRKTWFGQDNKIVWEQKYGTELDWRAQFDYCLQYFKDSRYIKIDGKPVYAIYNAWDIPNQDRFLSLWDEWAREAGLPGIYFVKTIGRHEKDECGRFSARVTREPNYTFAYGEKLFEKIWRVASTRTIDFINTKFLLKKGKGIVRLKTSYDMLWDRILNRENQDDKTFLGCFCDWDNSPRKSYNCNVMMGVTAEKFKNYFRKLYIKAQTIGSPMIVINAWNEWAEGAYLEPDEKNGYAFLEAIKEAKESRGIEK